MADQEASYEAPYERRKSARKSDLIIEVREPSRKRSWTAAQKLAILEEAAAPGAVPSEVMRRHGLSSSVFYTWKKQARALAPAGFMAIELAKAAPAPERGPGAIEIVLPSGIVVRVTGVVESRTLDLVLTGLRGRC